MTEWLIIFTNIITGGLRAAVCLFLIHRLLAAEKPGGKAIVIGVVGIAVITTVFSFLNLPVFYQTALEIVWIVACASRLQNANIRLSLFVSTFYEIGISLWMFLISAGMGILWHSDVFLDHTTLYGLASVWLLHMLLIALTFYIAKHPDMTGKDAFRLAYVLVVTGFLSIITLTAQKVLFIPDDTLDSWVILSVVLITSLLVFNMSRQYEVEKELASLKSEQTELLQRDYTALNNAYAVNARLFHDFHNHIGALKQLLSHEKYDKAIQYLDELQDPIREITDTVWTGDETVDYLINSKAAAAAASRIQLQVQVEFPHHTNIQSADLCAILGNLLDNALEAVKKIQEPEQKTVHLTIRRINQMLIIKVENHFNGMMNMQRGQLNTTKIESGLHGWGLKSARAAAEKYDGMVRTTYEANVFRAVATLSYHSVSIK